MQIPTLLDNYFQRQADISDIESNFRCPDDCCAPGCSMTDIIVDVTLFDLIRLSRELTTRVSHFFSEYCQLGLITCEENIHYKRLVIKMKKSCHFLSGNRCSVYDSKPLSCTLFPEIYHVKGQLTKLSQIPIFDSFPCIKKPLAISEKRSNTLKKLNRMRTHEQALSNDYLFGVPNFIVWSKPLTKKLRRRHSKKIIYSTRDYDNILNKTFNASGFQERISEKISRLDTISGMNHIFEKLDDRAMMTHLMGKMVRPDVVHKLERNYIKKLRRGLLSPATYFM
jgi:Fe-S-cluster containining protein